MIITSGYSVAKPCVKSALLLQPLLVVCGVIGQTNSERGMVIKALVMLKPGRTADMVMQKTLQKHIRCTLPRSNTRDKSSSGTPFPARKPANSDAVNCTNHEIHHLKMVRFHHCDPAGIVFYPQFFYLPHEVQEDFLSHIGFPEHEFIKSGIGLPIVDLQTEFLGMCRNGDQLLLKMALSKIGHYSPGMK